MSIGRLRPRKSEESATWHSYTTLYGKRLAIEAAHIPWSTPPYAVFRLQGTKKVLSRPIMGAEEFESFLLNLPKEGKP